MFRYDRGRRLETFFREVSSRHNLAYDKKYQIQRIEDEDYYVVTVTETQSILIAKHPLAIDVSHNAQNYENPTQFNLIPSISKTSPEESIEFERRKQNIPVKYLRIIGKIHSTKYIREVATTIYNSKAIGVGEKKEDTLTS